MEIGCHKLKAIKMDLPIAAGYRNVNIAISIEREFWLHQVEN
jgi:hypothetical protein